MRVERIGTATLYCGDAREFVPTLSGVDALISDPPYGMRWDGKITAGKGGNTPGLRSTQHGVTIHGDDEPFDPAPWLSIAPTVVLWGSNHYAARLPLGTTLVWVKRYDDAFGSFLSDAEVAWMAGGHGVYCFRDVSYKSEPDRGHPTQKPLGLMHWCLDRAKVAAGATVLDPFMGSGTTGVACVKTGRKFIGCEMEQRYFDLACRRMEAAQTQADLFVTPAPLDAAYQRSMFDESAA